MPARDPLQIQPQISLLLCNRLTCLLLQPNQWPFIVIVIVVMHLVKQHSHSNRFSPELNSPSIACELFRCESRMEVAMACTTSVGGTQALASKQSHCRSVRLKRAGALPNAGHLPIRSAHIHRQSSGVRCCLPESRPGDTRAEEGVVEAGDRDDDGSEKKTEKLSSQSSWEAKDVLGNDYLYRLGNEADNMNITVGARSGMVDSLFAGNFLGQEADIVFKYRQKVTRSFEHLTGEYYIAPVFMEKVVTHIVKNYLADQIDGKIPLILGVWGGKGQGKSFQTELIFKAMGIEPIIMSAGEMESEWAGEPGKLIRDRYRAAHLVIKNQGKMSCLMINDLDAGIGRFEHTQMTVNNQMVIGTLMNLCDNPTRVSVGQAWRESDIVKRVPIIVTGNDFSTIWAPLLRDGRMDKFYWQPTRIDLIKIVHQMYTKDGLSEDDIAAIIDTFPNQALDFYGALRSRTYDKLILEWVNSIGGAEQLGPKLLRRRKDDPPLPEFVPPTQNVEDLISAGYELAEEQKMVMKMKLSEEYMKKQTGPGIGLSLS